MKLKLNRAPVFLQLIAHRERGRAFKSMFANLGLAFRIQAVRLDAEVKSHSLIVADRLKPELQVSPTRNEAASQ